MNFHCLIKIAVLAHFGMVILLFISFMVPWILMTATIITPV